MTEICVLWSCRDIPDTLTSRIRISITHTHTYECKHQGIVQAVSVGRNIQRRGAKFPALEWRSSSLPVLSYLLLFLRSPSF